MRGLDTRGFMDGALKGFAVTDAYYNRQHNQGLQEKQDARAEQRLNMAEERHDLTMSEAQRKREQEMAQFTLGKIAQGMDLSDDEFQFLKENPKYWPALDPKTDESISVAQSVIDPDSPVGPNDPEALAAMNQLWAHRVNRGEGGRKRIAGLYPGQTPGTVAIDLEVEGEDGSKRNAPMTKNRGVEGDDEVLETPVEAMVNQVQGYRLLRNAFRSPQAQAQATKVLAALTGETTDTKPVVVNNKLVNPKTGAVIGDYDDAESDQYGQPYQHPQLGWGQDGPDGKFYPLDQPGSSNKAPSDVQTAEWMVANGIANSLDEAYTRVQESRSDPSRFVASYVDQELKAQEAAGIYPGDPNYRTTEQLRDNAIGALQEIRARTRGTAPETPPPPKGLEITGTETEVLPKDGSAVQQDDGSYRGQVNRSAGVNPQRTPVQNAPAETPVKSEVTPEQIKAAYKAGKITKEQAIAQLKTMGFE